MKFLLIPFPSPELNPLLSVLCVSYWNFVFIFCSNDLHTHTYTHTHLCSHRRIYSVVYVLIF